jgi:lipoic acid synthetase
VLRDRPEITIQLRVPIRKLRAVGEIFDLIDKAAAQTAGVDFLTIGQYLQPTREHLPVRRYYTPEEFVTLRDEAKRRGIRFVQSGPLVRSSYRAEEPFEGPESIP